MLDVPGYEAQAYVADNGEPAVCFWGKTGRAVTVTIFDGELVMSWHPADGEPGESSCFKAREGVNLGATARLIARYLDGESLEMETDG